MIEGEYSDYGTVTITIKDSSDTECTGAATDGVTFSPTTLALTEGHASDAAKEYTAVLNTDPGAGVTVTVAATSADTGAATVSPGSHTFTGGSSGNWGTAKTFTVTAVNDADTSNESFNVTHAVTATGNTAPYHGIAAGNVAVTVADAGHGVAVSPTSLSVRENDGEASYSVRLKGRPANAGNIVVSVTSSMTARATVAPGTLTFTQATWNTPQTVTVTGRTPGAVQVSHAITSTSDSTNYPTTTVIPPVAVTVTADTRQVLDLSVNRAQMTEGASGAEATTVLTVTATGATSNFQVAGGTSLLRFSGGGISSSDYSFTALARFSFGSPNYRVIRTVTATDDSFDEPNERMTIELRNLPSTVRAGTTAEVLLIDNDPTTVTLARTGSGAIAEDGGTATVTVTLSRRLLTGETVTAPLTVSGSGIATGDYTLARASGSSLNRGVTLVTTAPHSAAQPAVRFTGDNANTVQTATLTLTAVDDSAGEGASETLTVGFGAGARAVMSNLDRASGMGTAGTTPTGTASVEIADDDPDPDTTAPVLGSATVNGATLVLTYDEPLDTASVPAVGAFAVQVAGAARTVTGVTVAGSRVTLTLASAAAASEAVTVSYTVPGTNPIQDVAGNDAAALATRAVTNVAGDVDAPQLRGAAVNGATLVLNYNEPLDTASVPAASAFTVRVGGTARTVSGVAVSVRRVTLTLASAVTAGQAVTVSYAVPGTNPIQDAAGNDAAALTTRAVTNGTGDVTAPVLSSAAVSNVLQILLTYNEALDVTSVPAASAFTVRVAGTPRTVTGVAVSGSTVLITLASVITAGQTVTVSYTVPGTNPIQDVAGNAAAALTNRAVTNGLTLPVVSIGLPAVEGVTRRAGALVLAESLGATGIAFNVSVAPAQTAALPVCVLVAETGPDRVAAAAEGVKTVTIPAGTLSVDHTVTWTDTAADDGNGRVTVTALAPSDTRCSQTGYTVSGTDASDTALIEDDEATTVSLVASDTVMIEGEAAQTAAAVVTLGRALAAGEVIEVQLALTSATGARLPGHAMADFAVSATGPGVTVKNLNTAAPGLVFSGAGARSAAVTFTPVAGRRDADTADETVRVALNESILSASSGTDTNVGGRATRGTSHTVDLTIEEFVLPVVTIAGGAAVTEGGVATFTLTATPPPLATITVNLTVADAPHGDFVASGNQGAKTVSLTTSGTASYTVQTVGDAVDESSGPVTVTVTDGTGYEPGSTGNVGTVRVNDNDRTTVTLARDGTGAIAEDGGTATVTVTLSRRLHAGETVTAPLTVTGAGVTAADYTLGRASGSGLNRGVTLLTTAPHSAAEPAVVFTGHDTNTVQVATLTLTSSADTVDEGDSETLTVGFGTGARAVMSNLDRTTGTSADGTTPAGTAVVEVTDEDVPEVSVAPGAAVTEGTAATFTLTAAPVPAAPLTVNVTVGQTGNVAASGQTGARAVTVGTAGTASFTVATSNDTADEAAGAVTATVNAGDDYTPASGTATVAVNDDDPTVVTLLRAGTDPLVEGRSVEFSVTLPRALAAGETVDVPLAVSGVAVADFSLALKSGVANTGVTLSNANTLTPRLRFSGTGAQSATLVLTAALDGVNEGMEMLTMALGPDGTGANGFDHASLGTNVAGGADPHGTNNSFTVPVTDIALEIALSVASAGAAEGDSSHADYDVTVSKPAGSASVFYELCFSGTATRDEDGTVDAGEDYQVLNRGSGNPVQVVWGSGARAGCVATFSTTPLTTDSHTWKIRVLGDTAAESAEQIVVTLRASTATPLPTGWSVSAAGNPHIFTIRNDDTGTCDYASITWVSHGAWFGYVNEGGGGRFRLDFNKYRRAPGAAVAPHNFDIDYTVSSFSGATADDVVGGFTQRRVSVPAGAKHAWIEVVTAEDSVLEPQEAISIEASIADPCIRFRHLGEGGKLQNGKFLMYIEDNDGERKVTFDLSKTEVHEGDPADEWVDVNVTLSGTPWRHRYGDSLEYTVCFASTAWQSTSASETGANGYDYRVWSGGRIAGHSCVGGGIPSGATSSRLRIQVLDDAHEDSGETITARIQMNRAKMWADARITLDGPLYRLLTVLNDETAGQEGGGAPVVTVAADAASKTEGGDAVFTVTANPAPTAPLAVRVSVAAEGEYGVAAGARTVTVPATGSVKLTLATAGDAVDEPDGSVTVTVKGGKGYTAGAEASATVAILDDDGPAAVKTPVVTVAADAASATEGGDAAFTVTANPAPKTPLPVSVTVAVKGDWGVTAGSRTVTIPATGSAVLTLATTGDDADEPDGSITATVAAGDGYTVGTASSATVAILDDDAGLAPGVDPALVAAIRGYMAEPNRSAEHVVRWKRVLNTFGAESYPGLAPMTAAEAQGYADRGWPRWIPVVAALEKLERKPAMPKTPAAVPEVTVAADAASATEGAAATFTLTADPPPASPLAVTVSVAADGEFGVIAGSRTVTMPATGTVRLTLATMGDAADEPDGSVTLTVETGDGYTVGAQASGTVAILDDDLPLPVVTVAADAASVTEGGAATFTVTASPPPASALAVTVGVATEGDYGIAPGGRTVTIPATGSATLTLATTDDAADEPDGAVTLTVEAGNGYTTGTQASGTVAILDDDLPAPTVTIAAKAASVTEGTAAAFTVTADRAPDADLAVKLTVSEADGSAFVAAEHEGTATVTIPKGATEAAFTVATVGDDADEPDGSVTVTATAGDGYTVGTQASATVAILDDDVPEIAIAAVAASVTEGGNAAFTLTASPPPASALAVSVTVATSGEFGVTAGSRTVTIPATGSATLTLATADDAADEPDGSVTATVVAGDGYTVGSASSGTVAVEDDDLPPPQITIAADAAAITEGGAAAFTVTADRAPDADLAVTLAVSEAQGPGSGSGAGSDFVAADDEGPATVTIPKGGTVAAFTVATVDDAVDEPDGSVTVTVKAGDGYTLGAAASATVSVADNDAAATPMLSIEDATGPEGARMMFAVRLSAPADRQVIARVRAFESNPVSARMFTDFHYDDYAWGVVRFRPGETVKRVGVEIIDDSHDDGGETFELHIVWSQGAEIADDVAVGTIENSDPLPAAWLARFGRTVAEQALDGISGRMAASRTPGMQGTLAGQALSFDPAASGRSGAGGATPGASGALSGDRQAAMAMAEIARGFEPGPGQAFGDGGFGHHAGPFGDHRIGAAQSRTMTARDALLGSSFSLTGAKDGAGGTMAFWGRASQGSFDGKERGDGTDIGLDGEVTTGMLGADYARGRWLIGLALTQSTAEGKYASEGEPGCPQADDGTVPELCDRAVREGDGTVKASLTAAVPYAALQASERLKLWGAAGYGTGEVTLKTAMGERLSADTSWTMAAAGMRGDLMVPPAEGGPALALTSDALWARTSSDDTRELRATESDVTRLRLGLEGSWHVALENGGQLTPKLEVGARHDGGDAETGFGVELGGGIAWSDPDLGLSLDVSGRTLLAHEDGDLKDRGYAASLTYDPAPATRRGPSLSLRQEFGGQASGGLDALFQPEALEDRTGSEATSRWAMEAAWGFPVFGDRFTGSPHVGLGLATGARDYTLGWRLTPESRNAPDLSFGLKATRRESDAAEPEHTVGVEITARW